MGTSGELSSIHERGNEMNDLTARLDPSQSETEDFEAERIEYEDEHGMDNCGSDPWCGVDNCVECSL